MKCAPLVFFYSDGVTFRYSRGVQFVDTLLAANADPSFRRLRYFLYSMLGVADCHPFIRQGALGDPPVARQGRGAVPEVLLSSEKTERAK